ncbi:MAG: hypothetical protein L6R40_006343 [Gallowayella cf. fulva]|nr:MAG: hypothetical protein L6R40_006343 [Xanthomendoza cf. fulva]
MAKEKPPTDAEALLKKEKKAKKEKKEKRSETSGVIKKSSKKDHNDPSRSDKSLRKAQKAAEKEEKENKSGAEIPTSNDAPVANAVADVEMTTQLLNTLEAQNPGSVAVNDASNGDLTVKVKAKPLLGALVPFANPLADEKVGKKVLKGVKKAAKNKTLKRGVKEVVKSLRKSPPSTSTTSTTTITLPSSIVILAADISPMDVISHLPVLCEDHGIPYVFVPSRAELGAAGSTKRPTSVVMIGREVGKKKKEGEGGGEGKGEEEDWGEVYAELVKVVQKAGRGVRV